MKLFQTCKILGSLRLSFSFLVCWLNRWKLSLPSICQKRWHQLSGYSSREKSRFEAILNSSGMVVTSGFRKARHKFSSSFSEDIVPPRGLCTCLGIAVSAWECSFVLESTYPTLPRHRFICFDPKLKGQAEPCCRCAQPDCTHHNANMKQPPTVL